MKKYRIVKSARGWKVQNLDPRLAATRNKWAMWRTISTHRWHWAASLHLWWLRERNRK